MGDLIRDTLHSSGIDREIEMIITDAILQRWSDDSSSIPRQNHGNFKTNDAKIRLICERLSQKLERKYEKKFGKWKQNEEKRIDFMLAKLNDEYQRNIDVKQIELDNILERRQMELDEREQKLRKEMRLEIEKRNFELEKAWRAFEMAQADFLKSKDELEKKTVNSAMKMNIELTNLRREKMRLELRFDYVNQREQILAGTIKKAIDEAVRREYKCFHQKMSEWNAMEMDLRSKCNILCEKVEKLTNSQQKYQQSLYQIDSFKASRNLVDRRLDELSKDVLDTAEIPQRNDYDELVGDVTTLILDQNLSGRYKKTIAMNNLEIANLNKRSELLQETSAMRIQNLNERVQELVRRKGKLKLKLAKYKSGWNNEPNQSELNCTVSDSKEVKDCMSSESSSSSLQPLQCQSVNEQVSARLRNLDCISQSFQRTGGGSELSRNQIYDEKSHLYESDLNAKNFGKLKKVDGSDCEKLEPGVFWSQFEREVREKSDNLCSTRLSLSPMLEEKCEERKPMKEQNISKLNGSSELQLIGEVNKNRKEQNDAVIRFARTLMN